MDKKIYKMVIIAVFSALACVGTVINIPMPSGGMVHLGNFVMILAALLCGGLVGGLSGSIGMGLYDIMAGYHPSTYIRSFVLKFAIGFLVGYLFRLILKKKLNPTKLLYVFMSLFFASTITLIIMSCNCNEGIFVVGTKSMKLAEIIVAAVFSFLFALGLLISAIFSKKFNKIVKSALFAVTVGMLANIILELILRTILTTLLDGYQFDVAFTTAVCKLPGSIITAFITVVLGIMLYTPTYNAVKDINHLNDVEDYYEE